MSMRVAVLAAALALTGSVSATPGQEDVVAKRLELMKALGPSLKLVSEMVSGKSAFDADAAKEAMLKVEEHGKILPTLFPEGSHAGTRAAEIIWQEFDQFVAIYGDLAAAGREGADAAAAGDADGVRSALEKVGGACGSCHERYRTAG